MRNYATAGIFIRGRLFALPAFFAPSTPPNIVPSVLREGFLDGITLSLESL